jgi:putative ABC transport system permease protein
MPAIRLAISYPGANKGRTGMTIAMFSLIVFSLVMIASINENFARAFLSTDSTAGWTVSADVPATNPVTDFKGTLQSKGIDTSKFESVGTVTRPGSGIVRVRNTQGEDLDWENFETSVADPSFWDTSNIEFSGKANGYDSDDAIVEALNSDPNVVVVPASVLQSDGPDSGGFQPAGMGVDDKTFDAPTIEIAGANGEPVQVKVIGIMDAKYSNFFGIYSGQPAGDAIFASETSADTSYYVKLADGADSEAMAKDIERVLLPNGAQAYDIMQELEDEQASQKSFFYILEGFMGLGLVVGVAAVGVIALRAVVERRQQIGMMRALGFQKSLVANAFVIESAIVVILGVVSGAFFGLILAWQLMTSDDFTEGASMSGFTVPWLIIGITLGTAIVSAVLMAWLPARQASQVLPAEALRYE